MFVILKLQLLNEGGQITLKLLHFFIGTRQQMNAMHFGYELSPQYSNQIHSAHFTVRQIE